MFSRPRLDLLVNDTILDEFCVVAFWPEKRANWIDTASNDFVSKPSWRHWHHLIDIKPSSALLTSWDDHYDDENISRLLNILEKNRVLHWKRFWSWDINGRLSTIFPWRSKTTICPSVALWLEANITMVLDAIFSLELSDKKRSS